MTVKRARVVFAVLMHAAREGKHLTQYDKQQLSIARQVLRQIRKPVSNPDDTRVLVYEDSGLPVKIGDIVTDFRGDKWPLVGIEPPKHSGSTGRVHLRASDGFITTFYPSVIGAKWIDRKSIFKVIKGGKGNSNPNKGVLIYGKVNRIIATKLQKHICDAECKRHGHRYFHDFTSKAKMYGLPNGDLLITTR